SFILVIKEEGIMFDYLIYKERRQHLKEKLDKGIILLTGNEESPMNYSGNPYHFRQDSTFLYYIGLDEPNVHAIIDIDKDVEILFGDDPDLDDIIWMGPQPKMVDKAARTGIGKVKSLSELAAYLADCQKADREIHFLPPYRHEHLHNLSEWLNIKSKQIKDKVSKELIKAVVSQRSYKSEEEINEIETAHNITYEMHTTAMRMAKPGIAEKEIAGAIEGIALSRGASISFPSIVSVNGEILHNHYHGNVMYSGDMLINDSGAESKLHYAADITRTFPVSGKFTDRQKDIYNIVLDAQLSAIEAVKPGVKYSDIHKQAAKVIAEGLKDTGLMKGDTAEAVELGAHALFFPHGLGHMMGLDVHDMENLGEDFVGYNESIQRSDQFGLAYLRLARKLEPRFVLTVEPGIYFIPQLIDLWKSENKFTAFINYNVVEKYKDFGGIRIEDDVLVTEMGNRVIGKIIPKSVRDVEAMCSQ
ncbi:MAG: aminopeptidase P family protein, partial [Calditrichaceae bacterium]